MATFTHTRCFWGDMYEGRKDALLEAGVAKAEWFPAVQPKDVYGRTKRTFQVTDSGREIELRDRKALGTWSLSVRLTGDALEQRKREVEAEDYAGLNRHEAGLVATLTRLNDHARAKCFDMVEQFISETAKPRRPHPHLTLVVDQ